MRFVSFVTAALLIGIGYSLDIRSASAIDYPVEFNKCYVPAYIPMADDPQFQCANCTYQFDQILMMKICKAAQANPCAAFQPVNVDFVDATCMSAPETPEASCARYDCEHDQVYVTNCFCNSEPTFIPNAANNGIVALCFCECELREDPNQTDTYICGSGMSCYDAGVLP